MAVLESYIHLIAVIRPRITCDPVHFVEMEEFAILLLGVVALRDIDHVVMDILFHHIPRSTAQTETLALTDGVEPESAVFAEFASGLKLEDRAGTFAEVAADEVIVVYLAEETDPLAVAAECIRQT